MPNEKSHGRNPIAYLLQRVSRMGKKQRYAEALAEQLGTGGEKLAHGVKVAVREWSSAIQKELKEADTKAFPGVMERMEVLGGLQEKLEKVGVPKDKMDGVGQLCADWLSPQLNAAIASEAAQEKYRAWLSSEAERISQPEEVAKFQEIRRKAQAQQQFVEDFVHALEESSKTASQIQNEVENVAFAKDSARMMSKTHKETVFSAKAGETPTTTRVVDEHYFYKHPLLDKLADKSSQEGAQVVSKLEEEVVPAAAKREDYEQYIASDTIMRDVLIEKAVYQHMLNNLHILPVSDRQYIVDKMQEVGLDAPLVKGLLQKEITVAYDESQSWTLRIVDPIAIERLAKCQAFANIPGMESKIAESLEKEASVCALLILKNFNEVPKEQKVMALGQIAVCAEKDTEVQTKLNEFMSQKVWTALEASYPEPGDKLKYLDLVRAGDIADVDLKSLDPEIKEFALSVEGQSIFKDMALKAGEDIIAHLDELPREAQVKVIEQKLRPAFKSIGIKFSKLPDITAIQETHVVVRDQAGEALDKARIAAVNIVVDTGAASLVQSSGNTRPAQNGPLQPKKPGAIIEL